MARAHPALGCTGFLPLYPKRMKQALSKRHLIRPFMRPPSPAAPALQQALPLRLNLFGLARPPLRALRRFALRPRLGQLLLRGHLAPPQRRLALLLGGQEATIVQDNFLTVPNSLLFAIYRIAFNSPAGRAGGSFGMGVVSCYPRGAAGAPPAREEEFYSTVPSIIICCLQNCFYTLSRRHLRHRLNMPRWQGSWAEAGSGVGPGSWLCGAPPQHALPCPLPAHYCGGGGAPIPLFEACLGVAKKKRWAHKKTPRPAPPRPPRPGPARPAPPRPAPPAPAAGRAWP